MQERRNLHIDEAGNQDLSEGLYLVAVVLHEHNVDIEESIRLYAILHEAACPKELFLIAR